MILSIIAIAVSLISAANSVRTRRHQAYNSQHTSLMMHHQLLVTDHDGISPHWARWLRNPEEIGDCATSVYYLLAAHLGHYEKLVLEWRRPLSRLRWKPAGGHTSPNIGNDLNRWLEVVNEYLRTPLYSLYWAIDGDTYDSALSDEIGLSLEAQRNADILGDKVSIDWWHRGVRLMTSRAPDQTRLETFIAALQEVKNSSLP